MATTTEISRSSDTFTTIVTKVQFDFTDEGFGVVEVDIAHAEPDNEAAIQQGIANRRVSELAKLQAQG